jgi:hypothetical protein
MVIENLTPANPDELQQALAHALQFDGRTVGRDDGQDHCGASCRAAGGGGVRGYEEAGGSGSPGARALRSTGLKSDLRDGQGWWPVVHVHNWHRPSDTG